MGFVLCSKKLALAPDLMKQSSLFTITWQGKFCTQHHTMSFSFLKLTIFQILKSKNSWNSWIQMRLRWSLTRSLPETSSKVSAGSQFIFFLPQCSNAHCTVKVHKFVSLTSLLQLEMDRDFLLLLFFPELKTKLQMLKDFTTVQKALEKLLK